ncbi:MAG: rRNA adenine N-6-methyltransferase family protein [Nanoarchaeota archaeon]
MYSKILFFSSFLKYPKEIGSVVPSSKFLTDEILKNIDFKNARFIAEYGPGTGCITVEILKRARKDAKVLCFEINKKFCTYLGKKVKDKRLIIINDSAENIKKHLKKFNIPKIDYIISGLPFSALHASKKRAIIGETRDTLTNDGKFVVYQFLNSFKKYLCSYFPKISMKFVPLNIPPCFVYICEK